MPTDFRQLAARIVKLRADLEDEHMADMIVDALHQVWNARGAADVAAINEIPHTNDERVANAIEGLDR